MTEIPECGHEVTTAQGRVWVCIAHHIGDHHYFVRKYPWAEPSEQG